MEVHNIVQESGIKTMEKKMQKRKKKKKSKEMQKSKMAVWGGLTNSCEKKRSEKQREKDSHKHLNAEFQRTARRDKKAFLSDQCKEIEENNRIGKTRNLFKKIGDTREHFMQRWA